MKYKQWKIKLLNLFRFSFLFLSKVLTKPTNLAILQKIWCLAPSSKIQSLNHYEDGRQ